MTKAQVIALQQQLNAKGANLVVDGILGPKTKAAMEQFQASAASPTNGITSDQVKQLQMQLNAKGANLVVDGILGPKTQAAMQQAVSQEVATNPATADLVKQNGSNPDAIVNAYTTGDWSGVTDVTGKPFSNADQQAAYDQASAALTPGFNEQQNNDQFTTEQNLQNEQNAYKGFLKSNEQNFIQDKNTADQNAADNGVLFSGARMRNLNDLRKAYDQNQQQQRNTIGSEIAGTAQNYQYKYGNDAANKLSSYYNLGGNTYNAGTPQNNVTSSKLSSFYSPGAYNYYGTANATNKANTQIRAASLLANKANKILPSSYNTQL